MGGEGDGSTHPQGQRVGWVHASARITGGDGSTHPRGQRGGWVPTSARTTRGMGPRIREDNEGDGSPHPRGQRVGDGFPHPRGQRVGDRFPPTRGQRVGMGSRIRLHGGRLYAGTTEGDGFPHPRGQRGGWVPASARTPRGMGPRIREDNGWGEGDGSAPPS